MKKIKKMKKANWFRNSNKFFGLNVISCHKIRLQRIIGTGTFKKLLTAKLIAALLLPMFWFTMSQPISAQVSPATAGIPVNVPQSPPPTAFVIPSSNMFSNLFSRSDSLSDEENRFENFFNVFRTPELPAGLESGRVPNLAERLLATIDSSSSISKTSQVKSENLKRSENTNTDDPADSSEEKSVTQTDEIIAADNEIQSGSIEPSALPPTGTTSFDFDGDGKADIARWQPSNGEWKIRNSSAGQISTQLLGASGNQLVPADYDGDGKTDTAVFNPSTGNWSIKKSSDNTTQTISGFGQSGDRAVSAKYDGDAYADAAVYRNGVWLVKQSSTGNVVSISFGTTGDIPVVGNYDGDSLADYAVYRPSTGDWHVLGSSAGYFSAHWGIASDIPVPADYDGDGKTDFAVYRGITGSWFIYKSSTNDGSFITQNWGNYGDQPVPADYDGDGKADISIWRPTTGVWYSIKSADNSYDYKTLGVTGDTAVVSAYLKQIGSQVIPYDLAKARLSPKNATGGTDLYSRNFGWSSGLVGLSGRAGMDAGFGISYNSLVWTKQGSTMVFDADNSNVSPGFRFGFPTIEPAYYDSQTGKFAYLMVSPSGARTEFRQISASNKYETADSSYTQLSVKGGEDANTPVEDLDITVTGTSGTKMLFKWIAGAYRCEQIKDRNGNFITINHDEQGLLRTVTDTLGRVINVNYDNQLYPTSITQTWKSNNGAGSNVTHTWATFVYKYHTMNPSFDSSMTVFGPGNNTVIKVLDKLVYGVGATSTENTGETRFDYNDFGQVWKIRNIAPDSSSHVLNYVRTNLESPSANQTDCPRFSKTWNWTENFNLNSSGTAQETEIRNEIFENATFNLGGHSGTATKIEVKMINHPHNAISNTFVGSSGWMESLPIGTEDWADATSGTERKRWTWTNWTQDDPSAAQILNPRVIESKVGDPSNVKKTTAEYYMTAPNSTVSYFGLVKEVKVFDNDLSTVLKKSVMEYNLDVPYFTRRMIGIPSRVETHGKDEYGNLALTSVKTFHYDENAFDDTDVQQNINPVQHDGTNFGVNFVIGRGNLTSVKSHDVLWEAGPVVSQTRYDVAGSPVAQIDPGGRKVKIDYSDKFTDDLNNTLNRNTFAYPTKLIDPADNFSTVKYRFDTGANVEAESPIPHGSTAGKKTRRDYDSIGRLLRETIVNTGAYTRYEYPENPIQSKVFTTVVDANDNGGDAADEVLTESWSDGAGRTLRSRTIHPNSAGGFSGTKTEYDILGQITRTSVPTEIGNNWTFPNNTLWNAQEYDWKGRTVKSFNTDGTFSTADYEGCGCAGGEIVTVEGEQLAEGRRKQKIYSDTLGRQYKTEVMNWDGTVYSSTITKFNGRDQAVWIKQFEGPAPSNASDTDSCPVQPAEEPQTCQITKMTYDGQGRLKTKHTPQQDANKATVYDYYASGEVQSMTDARGATTTYTYNNRGLVTNINSTMPTTTNQSCFTGYEQNNSLTGSPIGYLNDGIGSDWKVKGWSLDPDNPTASNVVHIYIDGPAGGGGSHIGTVTANLPRPDVNTVTGYPGDHGFEYTIPNQYLDGQPHTIFAYGLDTGQDSPRLLNGSPKHFTYSPYAVEPALNASVAFNYDAAGNRLWMTDNLGRTDYEYDGLSRLKSETRAFTDTTQNGSPLNMAHAPLPNNSFKLQYTYGLANQLTSLTDPYDATINYGYDEAGRLNNVTGTTFGSVTNYASGAEYQAWGALKKLTYGSSLQMDIGYNDRLQANTYNLSNAQVGQVMNKTYDYYADGSLRYAQDLLDPRFDRLQTYDHLGRIKDGKSGAEARGGTVPQAEQAGNLPYRQSFQFNAFNNMKQRNNLHWGIDNWQGASNNMNYTYKNNRIQGIGWQYDADGRNTQSSSPDDPSSAVFNAAGQIARSNTSQSDAFRYYDGNGREIKRLSSHYTGEQNGQPIWTVKNKYYIRSSVLGNEVVSEAWANGRKNKTFVRAAGAQIAYQTAYSSETASLQEAVIFEYSDASGMTQRSTDRNGFSVASGDGGEGSPVETDPLGGNVGTSTPYIEIIQPYEPSPEYPMLQMYLDDAPMYVNGQRVSATLDGMPIGIGRAMSMLENGSAIPAALAMWQGVPGFSFQSHGMGMFTVSDVFTNNSGRFWAQPHGTLAEGWRIFEGGSSIYSLSWNIQKQTNDGYLTFKGEFLQGIIKTFAVQYLDKNPNCENFIDTLLNLLAVRNGVKLTGNLRNYLDEFGKTGTLKVRPGPQDGVSRAYQGGGILKPSWGEPGYGIHFGLTSTFMSKGKNIAGTYNILSFFHELIHAIGYTEGVENFGDEEIVDALQGADALGSDEELLESNSFLRDTMKITEGGYFGTNVWSKYLDYICGQSSNNPFPRKVKN